MSLWKRVYGFHEPHACPHSAGLAGSVGHAAGENSMESPVPFDQYGGYGSAIAEGADEKRTNNDTAKIRDTMRVFGYLSDGILCIQFLLISISFHELIIYLFYCTKSCCIILAIIIPKIINKTIIKVHYEENHK
jgi:hypothetical protein